MKHLLLCTLCFLFLFASSCESINDDRIPPLAVNIEFSNAGIWESCGGVTHALDSEKFIKEQLTPSNYPYTALTYTGFGGVLLVSNIINVPLAYDLACPVEAKNNIRISIDHKNHQAVCPQCGSVFDVFDNSGYPLSGPAAEKKYALKQYHVYGPNEFGGYTIQR